MAQRKKSTKNSTKKSARTNKRRTARGRKPKVALNGKSVIGLMLATVVLCTLFLALSFVFKEPQVSIKNLADRSVSQSSASLPVQKDDKKSNSGPVDFSANVQKPAASAVQKPSESTSSKPSGSTSSKPPVNSTQNNTAKPAAAGNSKPAVKTVASSGSAKPSSDIPSSLFTVPKAVNGAKIAFVIDDGGLNVSNVKRYTSLPFPMTIAVLPKLSHSKDCGWAVRSSGQELILHQPMQSQNLNLDPGPGAIKAGMSLSQVYSTVMENIAEIGPVKGLNNHEGSLITEDVMKMGAVLDAAMDKKIYFLDSRTTVNTMAPQAALERDFQIYERDIFIDNVLTREAMLKEIYRGLDIANKKGKVIMIGHVDKSVNILPALLNDLYPYLVKAGYKIVTPSTM